MDLDELQSVRDRERQTDKLQQLRPTFYADAGEFIQQLREQRSRAAERADDPFDAPEVSRLSDEIDTAEQTVEAIYEKRVGKIVKAASFAAADLPAESDGMTEEETKLFETLVEDIKENRQHVLDVLAGEGSDDESDEDGTESAGSGRAAAPTPSNPAEESPDPEPATSAESALASGPPTGVDERDDQSNGSDQSGGNVSAADVMGGSTADAGTAGAGDASDTAKTTDTGESRRDPPAPTPGGGEVESVSNDDPEVRKDGGRETESSPGVDRETVRITADVGDIFGVDEREYDLAENDVVTLPAANAEPLVERDAAERL